MIKQDLILRLLRAALTVYAPDALAQEQAPVGTAESVRLDVRTPFSLSTLIYQRSGAVTYEGHEYGPMHSPPGEGPKKNHLLTQYTATIVPEQYEMLAALAKTVDWGAAQEPFQKQGKWDAPDYELMVEFAGHKSGEFINKRLVCSKPKCPEPVLKLVEKAKSFWGKRFIERWKSL